MPTLYSPGTAPAAVTSHGVVVLEAGTSPALAARIRDLVADGRGLGGVIEALTGAYGSSLSAIPPFAVALAEGSSVRVAVRGPLVLEVQGETSERISGVGVTTWSERVIGGVTRVTLAATDAAGSPAGAVPPVEFPVRDGVVLADAVVWEPAVRSGEEAAVGEGALGQPPAAPISPAVPESERSPAPAAEASIDETIASSRETPRASVPASPGLIDSSAVLSVVGADTLLPGDSTFIPRTDPQPAPAATDVAATVVRSAPPSAPTQGDHDGHTVSVAEARAMRSGDPLTASMPPLAPPRPPAPGRIRLSTGQVVPLDRTVVIGRRPRSTRVSGTDLPHLIAVDSPQQDISRSHVELRVEGDSIVATDLRTTNGTTLRRVGADPVRLHPGESTVVVPGDVLDLGDGITVAVEGLS